MRLLAPLAFLIFFGCASAQQPAASQPLDEVALPTVYEARHFYLRPVTAQGDTLNILTDTGGNMYLAPWVAERAGLPVLATGQVVRGDSLYSSTFPGFTTATSIPPLVAAEGQLSPLSADGRFML